MNNRLWNCNNPYQGEFKRVLCCCSAGLLRSPTTAEVLSRKYGYNTRAVGVETSHALIPVDDVLITWADEIVVMNERHKQVLEHRFEMPEETPIVVLNIPDQYRFRDEELVKIIEERYEQATKQDDEATT